MHCALVGTADDVLADTKVTEANVAVVLQQHILWLDVPVCYALLVGISNGLCKLAHGGPDCRLLHS